MGYLPSSCHSGYHTVEEIALERLVPTAVIVLCCCSIRLEKDRGITDWTARRRTKSWRECDRTRAAYRLPSTGRCWPCETRRRWCEVRVICVSVCRIDLTKNEDRRPVRRKNPRRPRNPLTELGTISAWATYQRIQDEHCVVAPRNCPGQYRLCAPPSAQYLR